MDHSEQLQLSPADRLLKVVGDPRAAFAATAARPRPWLALVLAMALTVLITVLTMDISLEAGRDAALQTMESAGMSVAEAERAYEQSRGVQRSAGLVFGPLAVLATAALAALVYWGVANLLFGSRPPYLALLEMSAVAALVKVVGGLVRVPLVLSTGDAFASIGLGAFVDSGSRYQALLAPIDPFAIWAVFLVTIGLSRIYRVETGRAAAVAIGVWLLGIAAVGVPAMYFSGLGA